MSDIETRLWIPTEKIAELYAREYLKFKLAMERLGSFDCYIFDYIELEWEDDLSAFESDYWPDGFISEHLFKKMKDSNFLFYKAYKEIKEKFEQDFSCDLRIQYGVSGCEVYTSNWEKDNQEFYDHRIPKFVVNAYSLDRVKNLSPKLVTYEY